MRAFIAADVPMYIAECAQKGTQELKQYCSCTAVHPQNMHITLAFLGDIDSVDVYVQALKNISTDKISAETAGFDTFDMRGGRKVLYMDIRSNALNELYNLIKVSLIKSGHRLETKPFKAHLTTLRIKDVTDRKSFRNTLEKLNREHEKREFNIENISLYKSTLTPAGAVYEKLFMKDI